MSDKVLFLTGASSGIGAATARQAAKAGYKVALAARSLDKLNDLASELGEERALALRCDVDDLADQERAVAATLERFGRIDALFANAGRGGSPGGFTAANPQSWHDLIMTNVLGVAYTIRAGLEAVKTNRGHVVLTGSVAGRRTLAGSMYGVSKWAVSAIGYNLREELKGTGVRVTLIEPGVVDTPFFDETVPDALKPDDVARAVVYALTQPAHVDLHELVVLPTPPTE